MKLTKLQRYTIYCIIHYELSKRINNKKQIIGICSILAWDIVGLDGESDIYWKDLIKLLKELKIKGNTTDSFWFESNRDRLNAIEQCIEETHPYGKSSKD